MDRYTDEQMSILRFVLINKKRQDMLGMMIKFILGKQADCGFMLFNTSFSYEALKGFNRFKSRMYPKAKTLADKFNVQYVVQL